jgi:hypothetical protein
VRVPHLSRRVTGGAFEFGSFDGTNTFVYDGDGLRVQKASDSSSCMSPTVDQLYWRDTGGDTIAETDGSESTTNSSCNECVIFTGRRIAKSNPNSGNVYYYFADRLDLWMLKAVSNPSQP